MKTHVEEDGFITVYPSFQTQCAECGRFIPQRSAVQYECDDHCEDCANYKALEKLRREK